MNKKGFTLVELLATILILAIVLGIGTISITSIIKNSKEKNYKLLVTNIKDAAELYYQECKYSNNSGITCNANGNVKLGDLVTYGYLKGNKQDETNSKKYTIVNPLIDKENESNISCCIIKVEYTNKQIKISANGSDNSHNKCKSSSCPSNDDYK